jgi:adenylate cyclase
VTTVPHEIGAFPLEVGLIRRGRCHRPSNGYLDRYPPSCRDSRRRCGRLFAADGSGRGRHARTAQGASARVGRSENHGTPLPDREHTGDGMLAEFASVVDAVRCAAQVQRTMADRNAKTAEDRRITFRIGVNLGDVIAEEDDIYGDGVNIAARLETLAEPGGICISRVVRDQIRDKLPYPFEDRGEQSVKNIVRSVRVYALRPEVLAELPAASVPAAAPRRRIPLAVIAMATGAALVMTASLRDAVENCIKR